jgi:hypothetical protein
MQHQNQCGVPRRSIDFKVWKSIEILIEIYFLFFSQIQTPYKRWGAPASIQIKCNKFDVKCRGKYNRIGPDVQGDRWVRGPSRLTARSLFFCLFCWLRTSGFAQNSPPVPTMAAASPAERREARKEDFRNPLFLDSDHFSKDDTLSANMRKVRCLVACFAIFSAPLHIFWTYC